MKKIWKGKAFRLGLVLMLATGLVAVVALPVMAAQGDKAVGQGKVLQNIIRAKVTSIDQPGLSFVLKNNKGEQTIKVNDQTRFFIVPGMAKFTDVIKQKIEPKQIQAQEKVSNGMAVQKVTPGALPKIKENAGPKAEGKGIIAQDDLQWLEKWGKKADFTGLAVGDNAMVYLVPTANVPTAKVVLIIKKAVMKQVKGKIEAIGGGSININGETRVMLGYDKDTVFTLKGVTAVEAGQTAQVLYDSAKKLAKRVTIN